MTKKPCNNEELKKFSVPFGQLRLAEGLMRRLLSEAKQLQSLIKGGVVQLMHKDTPIDRVVEVKNLARSIASIIEHTPDYTYNGNRMSDDTIEYLTQIKALEKYAESAERQRLQGDEASLREPVEPFEVFKNKMVEEFKTRDKVHPSDFNPFWGVVTNQDGTVEYHWPSLRTPISSVEQLAEVFNDSYIENLKNKKGKDKRVLDDADPFLERMFESLAKELAEPMHQGIAHVYGDLSDLYHDQTAFENLYMGNMVKGLSAEEFAILEALTFDEKSDLQTAEFILHGKPFDMGDDKTNKALTTYFTNFIAVSEDMRQNSISQGIIVQKLPYNHIPQIHDANKIMITSPEVYAEDTINKLDWSMTDREAIGDQQKKVFVTAIHSNFKDWDERAILHDYDSGYGRAQHRRVMHFKDAKAYIEYMAKYGTSSSLKQTIRDHIHKGARAQAIVRRFGPGAKTLFKRIDAYLENVERTEQITSVDRERLAEARNIIAYMNNYVGDFSNPGALIKIYNNARNISVPIVLKNTAWRYSLSEMAKIVRMRQEFGFADPLMGPIQGLKAAADGLVAYLKFASGDAQFIEKMNTIGALHQLNINTVARIDRTSRATTSPFVQSMAIKISRMTGNDYTTLIQRGMAAMTFQSELHSLIGTKWEDLPEGFKEIGRQYNLTAEDWEALTLEDGNVDYFLQPGDLGTVWKKPLFSPKKLHDYKPSNVSMALMSMQAYFVNGAIQGTNTFLRMRVQKRLTQNPKTAVDIVTNEAVNAYMDFTGYSQEEYYESNRWTNGSRISRIKTYFKRHLWTTFLVGALSAYISEWAKGRKPDLLSIDFWLDAVVRMGGYHWAFLLYDMFQFIANTARGKSTERVGRGSGVAGTTVLSFSKAAYNLARGVFSDDPEKIKAGMRGLRRMVNTPAIDIIEPLVQRAIVDNILTLWDPDIAQELFMDEIENAARRDREFWPPPGAWTPNPLPEELTKKESYQD